MLVQLSVASHSNAKHLRISNSDCEAREIEAIRCMERFPEKLHKILGYLEHLGADNIAQWDEQGLSFHINEPSVFLGNVMPIFFKQTKFKSFQRQLTNYGFTRIASGYLKGSYYHKLFIKADPLLSRTIQRRRQASEEAISMTRIPLACNTKKHTRGVDQATAGQKGVLPQSRGCRRAQEKLPSESISCPFPPLFLSSSFLPSRCDGQEQHNTRGLSSAVNYEGLVLKPTSSNGISLLNLTRYAVPGNEKKRCLPSLLPGAEQHLHSLTNIFFSSSHKEDTRLHKQVAFGERNRHGENNITAEAVEISRTSGCPSTGVRMINEDVDESFFDDGIFHVFD